MSTDGADWDSSASAWIANMGEQGDRGRRFVLDPALRARLSDSSFRRALDVGCGEGRVCRLMQALGIETVGIDPTEAMIAEARRRDPAGDYRVGGAERLAFADASFDLAVTCLTLIDITDFRTAIAEMARVLSPGGTLLAANINPVQSAGMGKGWRRDAEGRPAEFALDRYLDEWWEWVEWANIRVRNWHRPLSAYVQAYLAAGLTLVWYEDLKPVDGFGEDERRLWDRAPWFDLMEWRKPP
jgi:SAM-dependent methyltransferase